MSEKIQEHDFVELDYTGKIAEGAVFDTTVEKTARGAGLFSEKMKYGPVVICVGEKQILPGIDEELIGKETGKEYVFKLSPEKAFGKRDVKKIKIVPISTFKENQIEPYPGLQIDVDGVMGTVIRATGGRIIVNFNHPLAGKEVTYVINVVRKVTDNKEKIVSFLNTTFKIPLEKIKVEINGEKAAAEIPVQFPPQILEMLGKRMEELTQLKEVKFSVTAVEKKEKK